MYVFMYVYMCVYIIYLIIGYTGHYNYIKLNENNDNTCTQGAFTI